MAVGQIPRLLKMALRRLPVILLIKSGCEENKSGLELKAMTYICLLNILDAMGVYAVFWTKHTLVTLNEIELT